MILSAVRHGVGEDGLPRVLTDPSAMTEALRAEWAPVFAQKPFDAEVTQTVAERNEKLFDFQGVLPPSVEDFESVGAKSKELSAPGPDGIPYGAWQVIGRRGAMTLFAVGAALECGAVPPVDFNESITVFPPKGEESGDADFVCCAPSNVRPISLNNSDNKLVCTVYNNKLSVETTKHISQIQRGFIRERQFTENIVELDAKAREYSMTADAGSMPALVLWNFTAAFPSVLHMWIFMMLDVCGIPRAYVNVIRSVYLDCRTFVYAAGGKSLLCTFLSGVLQGCPLSGSLFSIAIDPFLCFIDSALEGGRLGIVRACADDIGAAIKSSQVLKPSNHVFKLARLAAGLKVKTKKCVIVPVYTSCTLSTQSVWKDWLATHLPHWGDFSIRGSAKYLGIFIGPAAGSVQWCVQAQKWTDRSRAIAAQGYHCFIIRCAVLSAPVACS